MYYVIVNLKNFIRHSRLMFVMLVIMQVFSSVSVLFAYGVYNNFRYERSSELADTTSITIGFSESVRFSDIKKAMNEVPKDILTESESIMLSTKYYTDGSSVISEPLVDEMKEWETDGGIIFGVPEENIVSILISMKYDPEQGQYMKQKREAALDVLEQLRMKEYADKQVSELSGGQKQRIAIARTLVKGTKTILADEPTGALDTKTSAEIIGILRALNKQGRTVIIVTHDPKVAEQCNRVIEISDGKIVR